MTTGASAQDRVLADALASAPAYFRLYAALIEDIVRAGEAGVRLPTRRALARRFGVSMVTVRGALDLLEKDGVTRAGDIYRYVRASAARPSTLEQLRSWSSGILRSSVPAGMAGTSET